MKLWLVILLTSIAHAQPSCFDAVGAPEIKAGEYRLVRESRDLYYKDKGPIKLLPSDFPPYRVVESLLVHGALTHERVRSLFRDVGSSAVDVSRFLEAFRERLRTLDPEFSDIRSAVKQGVYLRSLAEFEQYQGIGFYRKDFVSVMTHMESGRERAVDPAVFDVAKMILRAAPQALEAKDIKDALGSLPATLTPHNLVSSANRTLRQLMEIQDSPIIKQDQSFKFTPLSSSTLPLPVAPIAAMRSKEVALPPAPLFQEGDFTLAFSFTNRLQLSPVNNQARWDGRVIQLGDLEYLVLEALLENESKVSAPLDLVKGVPGVQYVKIPTLVRNVLVDLVEKFKKVDPSFAQIVCATQRDPIYGWLDQVRSLGIYQWRSL